MSDHSEIAWTDASWNPTRGCSLVSDGCRNCYAMKQAHRFSGPGGAYEGLTRLGPTGPTWNGTVHVAPDKLDEPLRWTRPRRIFVDSMSDLFHQDVPTSYIDHVWTVMLLAPHHTFQVLTKRPERMRAYLSDPTLYERILRTATAYRVERPALGSIGISNPATHPPRWIWIGVSIENQVCADVRVPVLLKTPGRIHFLSYEPALGPITFVPDWLKDLDWIIVGGESGPGARDCQVEWIASTIAQCRGAGVYCFVKQLGRRPRRASVPVKLLDAKGGNLLEWPREFQVRQTPRLTDGRSANTLGNRGDG